jgi:spore coat-associated protein N
MSILQKNRKAALGVGIAAVAAATLALSAGTYAAFIDEETGPGGTLAAATLDLTVGGAPGQATLLDVSNITPGHDLAPTTLTVKNEGTIAGKLTGFVTITGSDGTCTEPELEAEGGSSCAAQGNLQEQLKVNVGGFGPLPLPLLNNAKFIDGVTVQPGQELTVTVDFSLPHGAANNKVQGDSLKIESKLTLEQLSQ